MQGEDKGHFAFQLHSGGSGNRSWYVSQLDNTKTSSGWGLKRGRTLRMRSTWLKCLSIANRGIFRWTMITRSSKKPNYFSLRHEALYLTGVDIQVALRSALNVE